MSRTIIAAEIGYKDTTVSPGETSYLYAASESFVTAADDTLANTYFAGRLDGEVRYRVKIKTDFWGGGSSVGIGSVEVINDDGELDSWVLKEFRDQPIILKSHTSGASYDSATVLINAIIERMEVVNEKILRFVIRDPASDLVVPMTTDVYTSGDAEGILKPIAFGQPELVKPVLIDEATLEYAVTDATSGMSVLTVYDQGVSVDFNPTASGFKLLTDPSGGIRATIITSGTGNDPVLTEAPTLYTLSGESKTIQMFDGGSEHDMSTANHSRASSSGGKYYFEMYVDDHRTLTEDRDIQSFGDGEGSFAFGITSAAVVSTQDPKDTGFYCLSAGHWRTGGASTYRKFRGYGNDVLLDEFDETSTVLLRGKTFGVKVDFDSSPMTIEFMLDDANPETGSSPATTAFGPHAIPDGTYSPVIGAVYEPLTGDNVVSIRLIEADFVYSVPSGYTAWSEGITADSTFSKLVDSITDRLPNVSFDSTSVTEIDALSHSSPAVAYTYGYYLDDSFTASKLLTAACSSIGAAWWVNRLGDVQFTQLTAPGTSVATIDDTQITGDISIATDYAKGLSNGIGALRNWSPYRESEVSGTATEVWKQQISRDYQVEYRSTNVLASGYAHATGAKLP